MKAVKCPTCETAVEWSAQSRWKPFCSERCKLIDLGDWIEEKNRITDKQDRQVFLPAEEPN